MSDDTKKIKRAALFVCLGNICRSPIAEAVFNHLLHERGVSNQWRVDSAGLGGWHTGNRADPRARATLTRHQIDYENRARQIDESDYHEYDYIFGMDENNISCLKNDKPANAKANILLLGDYDPEGDQIIRDPYYDTGSEGFEKCYQQCLRSCRAFLDSLND